MPIRFSLFNVSPYRLKVRVETAHRCSRIGADELANVVNDPYLITAGIDPEERRRIVVENSESEAPHVYIEITATDGGLTRFGVTSTDDIKKVSFFADSKHSWIVSDAEIRRQKAGSADCVADEYTDEEKLTSMWNAERTFEGQLVDKWEGRDIVKQCDWTPVTPDSTVRLHFNATCPIRHSSSADFEFLKQLYRRAYDSRIADAPADGNAADLREELPTVNIFNDTPYCLHIHVHDSKSSKWYWNDPWSTGNGKAASGPRTLSFQTKEDRLFVIIYAVDDIGRRFRHASFYTPNDASWIIDDCCVFRRRADPAAAEYVAEEYTEWNDEVCQTFEKRKVHYWLSANYAENFHQRGVRAAVVSDASHQQDGEKRAIAVLTRFCGARIYSPMTADELGMIAFLIDNVDLVKLDRCSPMAFTGDGVEALVNSTYGLFDRDRPTAMRSFERLENRTEYRIEIDTTYTANDEWRMCAARGPKPKFCGNRLFAAVHLHDDLEGSDDLPRSQLQLALWMSLVYATDVWVSRDDGSEEPRRPPGVEGESAAVFELVASFERSTDCILRYWICEKKRHRRFDTGYCCSFNLS